MKFLFDLNYKRGVFGAIGFYFVYTILIFILIASLGAFIGSRVSLEEGKRYGMLLGRFTALGVPLIFSFLILKAKNLFKNRSALIIAFLSVAAALFGGLILGFIPVAFLTTRKPNK